MPLDLRQIFEVPGESKDLDCSMQLDGIEIGGANPFETPVLIKGRVENRLGVVTISYTAEYKMHYLCDRCLSDEHREYKMNFEHILLKDPNAAGASDDYILTEGNSLDLDELVVSDILLELPTKLLCKEDCKGLCSSCGKNLNEGKCGCDEKTVDPRLEVLRQLLDKKDD